MSMEGRPVVTATILTASLAGEEAHTISDKWTTMTKDPNKKPNKKQEYSEKLRSRFGEAFLPFATMLESTNEKKDYRKRKGRNRKKKLNKINIIPN